MQHSITCSCGQLTGTLSTTDNAQRCVCYCDDCQAFARFLGRESETLDDIGGTDVIQTQPSYISFDQGQSNLACMRLTDTGMLRWYAACCKTPIANTDADIKKAFVGIVHNCLDASGESMDNVFGPVKGLVFTQYATTSTPPKSRGILSLGFGVAKSLVKARLSGSYKINPFFNAESGVPVAEPMVLSAEQLSKVKIPVRSG